MTKGIIHPLLLALFPVLSLYVHNARRVQFAEALGAALAVLLSALLVWSLLRLLLGRRFLGVKKVFMMS